MPSKTEETKGQQGTGKHPHKSAEEPFPHTDDKEQGKSHSSSAHSNASHSSAAQHEPAGIQGKEQSGSHSGASSHASESSDLKSREYTDKDGNVHHHTKAYEEGHKADK